MEGKPPVERGRHLLRPCSLAGSRWAPAAAGLCSVALGGVFGSEVLTPDDVLASLGIPPLLAAVWTLSQPLARAVSAVAVALFAAVLALEATNRLTLVAIGATGLVLAVAARAAATRLAEPRPRPAPTTTGVAGLTRREAEVARLASQGYMASEIAAALGISERTVESHLAHVYAKLGVTSKRALVRMGDTLSGR